MRCDRHTFPWECVHAAIDPTRVREAVPESRLLRSEGRLGVHRQGRHCKSMDELWPLQKLPWRHRERWRRQQGWREVNGRGDCEHDRQKHRITRKSESQPQPVFPEQRNKVSYLRGSPKLYQFVRAGILHQASHLLSFHHRNISRRLWSRVQHSGGGWRNVHGGHNGELARSYSRKCAITTNTLDRAWKSGGKTCSAIYWQLQPANPTEWAVESEWGKSRVHAELDKGKYFPR